MANFPSKWYDFNNHKQLKKIRDDLNNTHSLRIQIAASLIVAIISFVLGDYVKKWDWYFQLLFCLGLSLVIVGVLFYPYVVKTIMNKLQSNIIINGKDAISLFDDEIVYDILVASEYFENRNLIPDSDLSNELKTFYDIEMEYYLKSSIEKLLLFLPNYPEVFGNGKKQISINRFNNITKLIDTLISKGPVILDDDLLSSYKSLCKDVSTIK